MPIPGTRRIARLDENAAAARIALDADERAHIDAVRAEHKVAGLRYPEWSMGTVNGCWRTVEGDRAYTGACTLAAPFETRIPMARTLRTALIAAFVIAFGAWVFFAPYLTVRSMRLAAEAGDAEAFSRHVDYPALRESVKAELSKAMNAQIVNLAGGSELGRFGAKIAGALGNQALGPAVDALVRPEALSALFAGRGLADEYALLPSPPANGGGTPVSDVGSAASENDDAARSGGLSEFEIARSGIRATMGYEGLSRFAVNVDEPSRGRRIVLILTRDKLLWWKLSAVELPDG